MAFSWSIPNACTFCKLSPSTNFHIFNIYIPETHLTEKVWPVLTPSGWCWEAACVFASFTSSLRQVETPSLLDCAWDRGRIEVEALCLLPSMIMRNFSEQADKKWCPLLALLALLSLKLPIVEHFEIRKFFINICWYFDNLRKNPLGQRLKVFDKVYTQSIPSV